MYVGINLPAKHNTPINAALDNGYDFVTSRVTSSSYRRKVQALAHRAKTTTVPPPIEDDLSLAANDEHIGQTVALAAPWVELDAKDATLASISLQVLVHEIEYLNFCGVAYVVLAGPRRRTHLPRYAQAVSRLMQMAPNLTFLLHATLTEEFSNDVPPADYFSTWRVWETVSTLCAQPGSKTSGTPQLRLLLEIPSHALPQVLLDRWACEDVAMIVLSAAGVFVPNAKNYPVLAKQTQQLVLRFLKSQPLVLLKDIDGVDDACLMYMRHLHSRLPTDKLDKHAQMENVLQLPLEPQRHNLENATYQVFEEDPIKYARYFAAIKQALASLTAHSELVVVVAGAGRGRLVDEVLKAGSELGTDLLVHAVEKNPGAVAYLRTYQRVKWGDKVKIHSTDVKTWAAPHKADLILSEMLGSFGDNELAPEVLAAVRNALHDHGRFIPQRHSSWVQPVFSPLLFAKCSQQPDGGPFVVNISKGQALAQPQLAWTFEYPSAGTLQRDNKLCFTFAHQGTVHGFAGYFEAQLFGDVALSTLPQTAAPPSSWYPLWFPLEQPLLVYSGWEAELHLWRTSEAAGVSYQWCVEIFKREGGHKIKLVGTRIHNLGAHTKYS